MFGMSNLLKAFLGRKHRTINNQKRLERKLLLEMLEDRIVPSTVTIAAIQNGAETGTNGIFQISRTDTLGDLAVGYTFNSGASTAVSGTDFTALSGSATIPNGDASVNVNVTPIDRSIFWGGKTVEVDLSSGSYTLGSPNTAILTIVDDDANPVTMNNPGAQTNAEGDTVSLNVSATYTGSYSVNYSAVNLPAGLSIDSSTGVISGTVSSGDAASFGGVYQTTVIANDGNGGLGQTSFSWTISNTPITPTPDTPSNQTSTAGQTVSLALSASNPDGGQLTYEMSGAPQGLTIDSSTGLISGTIATSAASPTPYTVTFYASNGTSDNTTTFNWTVNAANLSPSITSPGDQFNVGGDQVSLPVSATDPNGDSLAFTASGLPTGLTIDGVTGTIAGTISTSAWSATPYSVSVTASDGSLTDTASFSWLVGVINVAPPGAQANADGDAVSLFMNAEDATGATLTFSATGLPSGLSIDSSAGVISGTIAAGAYASSPYTTVVTASDGTHNGTTTFTWTVGKISLTNPGNQSNIEGDSVSLTPTFGNVDSETVTFSASGLPSGLSINSTTGEISGTVGLTDHVASPYQITVSMSDGTTTLSEPFVWTVAPAVAIANPGDQSGGSLQIQAASLTGASLSYSASGLPTGLSINSSTGLISGPIAVSGTTFTVTVTATDGTASNSQTFTWVVPVTVLGLPNPISLPSPGNQINLDGATVSLSASASYLGLGTLSYSVTGLPTGLSIDSSTGLISGTVGDTADTAGPFSVVVTATDGTNTATTSFGWQINPVVVMGSIGNQSSTGGDTGSMTVSATDALSSTLSYSATGLPSGLSISSSTGVISGTISTGAASSTPYSATVTASDGTFSASQTFTWTVAFLSLVNPGSQVGVDNGTVSVALDALNATGNTLTYSATGLPSGLSIDSSTGVISGTLASGADADSGYFVTATATDGTYTASQVIAFSVTKVGMTNPGNQTNVEGDSVSLSIAAAAGSGTLTYSATGLPDGLSINSSTGAITGTVAAGDAANGSYAVSVLATDGTNAASQTITWTVNPVVTVTAISDQTNSEGDTVSLSVSATDANSSTLTYSVTGLPDGLSINSSTGVISGTVSTGDFATAPAYAVQVTASDGTYSASVDFLWNIANPSETAPTLTNPGTKSNQAGDTVAFKLSATYASGDMMTYSATGLPDGLYIDPYVGEIFGTIADDSVNTAPYSVTVSIDDGQGGIANQTFNWFITSSSISVEAGSAGSVTDGIYTGIITLATFSTPDLNAQASNFAVAANWGDGSSGNAWIQGSSGSFSVVGYHIYSEAGSDTIDVVITNPGGGTSGGATTVSATVADAALTISSGGTFDPVAGQLTTMVVATFNDANLLYTASNFAATVIWGDGSSGSGTVTSMGGGLYGISGQDTYGSVGTYTYSVTITDTAGTSASTTGTSIVKGIQTIPPLTLVGSNVSYTPNVAFSNVLVATFTDPNTSDTTSNFVAFINWDDGTSLDSTTISGSNGAFSIYASHTYTVASTYAFSVYLIQNLTIFYQAAAIAQAPAAAQGGALVGNTTVPGNSSYAYTIPVVPPSPWRNVRAYLTDDAGNPPNPLLASIATSGQNFVQLNFYNYTFGYVVLHYDITDANGGVWRFSEEIYIVQVSLGSSEFSGYLGAAAVATYSNGELTSVTIVGSSGMTADDPVTIAYSAEIVLHASAGADLSQIKVGPVQLATDMGAFGIYEPYPRALGAWGVYEPMLNGQSIFGNTFLDGGSGGFAFYSAPATFTNDVTMGSISASDSPNSLFPGSLKPQPYYLMRYLISCSFNWDFQLSLAATIGDGQYWSEYSTGWQDRLGANPTSPTGPGLVAIPTFWSTITSPTPITWSGPNGNSAILSKNWKLVFPS